MLPGEAKAETVALAICLVVAGGALHGVAMATGQQTPLGGGCCLCRRGQPRPCGNILAKALLCCSSSAAAKCPTKTLESFSGLRWILLGHVDYWKQWRWWSGVLCDGAGGLFIWPAMPILARQVLMPLATVVQLVTAYSLALAFFREKVAI